MAEFYACLSFYPKNVTEERKTQRTLFELFKEASRLYNCLATNSDRIRESGWYQTGLFYSIPPRHQGGTAWHCSRVRETVVDGGMKEQPVVL